jgi:hypothetical protein
VKSFVKIPHIDINPDYILASFHCGSSLGHVLDAGARAARLGNCAKKSALGPFLIACDSVQNGESLTSIDSLVLAVNSIASHIKEVPNLVQRAARAAKVDRCAVVQAGQGSLNLARGVGLRAIGGDASIGEGL